MEMLKNGVLSSSFKNAEITIESNIPRAYIYGTYSEKRSKKIKTLFKNIKEVVYG